MPIYFVNVDNLTAGYKWGNHGHLYTFPRGDAVKEQEAHAAATRQAQAAYAHGYRGHST